MSRSMEKKTFPCELKSFSAQEGKFAAYVSIFGNVDLGGDIVEPGAFKQTIKRNRSSSKFKGFPVMRNHQDLIGISTKEVEDNTGLLIEGRISTSSNVPKAIETLQLMEEEILNGWSFQYETIRSNVDKEGIRHLIELRYHEGGPVDLAMNPETYTVDLKSVVPFGDLPLADRSHSWDANAARKRLKTWAIGANDEIDWSKYKKGFVLFVDPGDTVASYKLPVADLVNGELTAIPQAIFSAASVLSGGRGGVDVSSDDIEGAKRHLSRYYKKMDKEPPWDKGLGIEEALAFVYDYALQYKGDGNELYTVKSVIEVLKGLPSPPETPGVLPPSPAGLIESLERIRKAASI